MRTLAKKTLVLSSISLLAAMFVPLGAEQSFRPGPADQYPHQRNGDVTVGAQPFDSLAMTKPVFGKKADLVRYGILPVLLVVENGGKEALDLENIEVQLETSDGRHVIALDPQEVPFVAVGQQRSPGGKSPLSRNKKSPLDVPEIRQWAFSGKTLPGGQKASGFFYFRAQVEQGMKMYVSGMAERPSGKQLLYFEIPF
jgi:hypothetical protein